MFELSRDVLLELLRNICGRKEASSMTRLGLQIHCCSNTWCCY